ncbi:hypothetical protein C0995_014252 [Termitomyces sp. Mi166|nr:hypothetical protein C0995_014252 [Termitomyces sp. Mi166\
MEAEWLGFQVLVGNLAYTLLSGIRQDEGETFPMTYPHGRDSSTVTVYDVAQPHTSNNIANVPSNVKKPSEKNGCHDTEQVVYVEFSEGDPRNPVNFSKRRKWVITLIASCATVVSSAPDVKLATAVATFSPGIPSMIGDLKCSQFQALIALGVFPLGFGVIPLITAPFSEDFGRQPIYFFSSIGFALMVVMAALAKNINTVIWARFLQGAFASPGATMVGGTIADIWLPHERGLPMNIFVLVAIGFTGLGPVYAGWVAMDPRLGWRWCQWIQLIICGVYMALVLIGLRETRASVLLTKMARKMRLETGDDKFRSRAEDEKDSLTRRIYNSCTRPVQTLYQKYYAKRGPEARLHTTCAAAFLIPVGVLIYAWTSFPDVHWIAQAIGLVLWDLRVFSARRSRIVS